MVSSQQTNWKLLAEVFIVTEAFCSSQNKLNSFRQQFYCRCTAGINIIEKFPSSSDSVYEISSAGELCEVTVEFFYIFYITAQAQR